MVLNPTPDIDSFDSPDSGDTYNAPGVYPPHPPVPSLLGFRTGMFNDEAKQRFIDAQIRLAQREFGFTPNPVEREGINYYHAVFYASEAKGALHGTLGGAALALLLIRRQKAVGTPFKWVGDLLRAPPKVQLLVSRLANFTFITMVGRFWGLTSYGISAFNSVAHQQKEDPNMQRYLSMRRKWVEQRQANAHARLPMKTVVEEVRQNERDRAAGMGKPEDDPQSLGGLDFYNDKSPEDGGKDRTEEDIAAARRLNAIEAATRERTVRQAARARSAQKPQDSSQDDDPFFGDSDSRSESQTQATAPAPAQGGWRTTQQQSKGGSAWDRLRRGEQPPGQQAPPEHPERPGASSSWPRRPPMKGFGNSDRGAEVKENTLPFSNSDHERAAKEEAQRLFDEKVQRERQGEGLDGFVNDAGQGWRGR